MSAAARAGLLLAGLAAGARAGQPPPTAASRSLGEGLEAYEGARFGEAVSKLSRAMEQHPGYKTAAAFRALCLWTSGDAAGAEEDARLAAKLKPNDAESYSARGFARFVLKDMNGAAGDFSTAIRRDPGFALAHFGMGSVLSSQERPKEALASLDRAAELAPRAALFLVVRATVLDKLKDFPRAIKDYGRALALAPDFTWARLYRGRDYREVKEFGAAVADLTAFLDRHPESAEALYLRSNASYLSGDPVSAAKDLDRVIAIEPGNGLAYANRGQMRAEAGDTKGALADLRRAKELSPARAVQIQAAIDALSPPGKAAADARPNLPGAEAPPARVQVTPGVAAERCPPEGCVDNPSPPAAARPKAPAATLDDAGRGSDRDPLFIQ